MTPENLLNLLQSEIEFSYSRSSGSGGQNVNKVNSKVELRLNILDSKFIAPDIKLRILNLYANKINNLGELILVSEAQRDQTRNRQECLSKLQQIIIHCAKPPKKRLKTKVSRRAKAKRVDNKKFKSQKKKMRRGAYE